MPIDVGGGGKIGGAGPSKTSSDALSGPAQPMDFEIGSPTDLVPMPCVAEVAAPARPALARAEDRMLSAVQQVRENLHRLVPADHAAMLEDALSVLVPKIATGQADIEDILVLVQRHDSVREELSRLAFGLTQQRSLEVGAAPQGGGFSDLPGPIDPTRPPKFVCPRYHECRRVYFRHNVLAPVPACDVHRLAMVLKP